MLLKIFRRITAKYTTLQRIRNRACTNFYLIFTLTVCYFVLMEFIYAEPAKDNYIYNNRKGGFVRNN